MSPKLDSLTITPKMETLPSHKTDKSKSVANWHGLRLITIWRGDHKNAPGKPDSFERLNYRDKRLADTVGGIASVEL